MAAHPGAAPLPDGPVGPYAFVFWNDELDVGAVVDQLRDIASAGFVGVTLSVRIGLSRQVGYLTDEHLRLVRVAVDECARLGLSVMLYDEASYPSGSAGGAVVARDPSFAARCLLPVVRDVVGPAHEYWRPALGRDLDARLLAVVVRPRPEAASPSAAAGDGAAAEPPAGTVLPVRDPGVVRLDLAPGDWQVTAVFDAASGGTIRGPYADTDDGHAQAPPAADLLNPDAVATFTQLTHDAYARVLGDHLGTTVVAVFTDEPFLLGRGHRPQARPYSRGLEDELGLPTAEVLRRLPELWDGPEPRAGGLDPRATGFARRWTDAVRARLDRVYYGTLSRWCADHGIALTGHPAEPDDLETTALLHWPGQDTVWRWVLPGPTATDGPESTAAKVAASAARRRSAGTGRTVPSMTEVLGAYGWRLTLDEARWLLDWYLARGVTVPVWHAFFSSVRGGRAFESEPDLGVHNSWWPHLPPLVAYTRRVAELLHAAPPVWPVGVLSPGDAAPSGPVVRALLEHQVDFGYTTGGEGFAVVVDPADGPVDVAALTETLRGLGEPVVSADPAAPSLRVVTLADRGGFLFFNEGDVALDVTLDLPWLPADPCWWDPFTDVRTAVDGHDGGTRLVLGRRQTLALVPATGAAVVGPPALPLGRTLEIAGWTGTVHRAICDLASIQDSPVPVEAPTLGLGDWTRQPVLRRFAGTYRYAADVDVPPGAHDAVLDLGTVGDAATVLVDGQVAGHTLSAPHRVSLRDLAPGRHRIEVLVSNNAAVYYEGSQTLSGLVGPVTLDV